MVRVKESKKYPSALERDYSTAFGFITTGRNKLNDLLENNELSETTNIQLNNIISKLVKLERDLDNIDITK